jgi:hypothetical protein
MTNKSILNMRKTEARESQGWDRQFLEFSSQTLTELCSLTQQQDEWIQVHLDLLHTHLCTYSTECTWSATHSPLHLFHRMYLICYILTSALIPQNVLDWYTPFQNLHLPRRPLIFHVPMDLHSQYLM